MIQHFVKPAVPVTAVQFKGDQESIDEIFHWLNGAFYVGMGVDHGEFRLVTELDEAGRVHFDAPPFLIIKTRNGEERVNPSDWVVRFDAERVSVYDELSFTFAFERGGN